MELNFTFRPKILETLKGYTRQLFMADLIAGITVGIVALPLAMAFAIASGVKPEAGIFTAVIAGFIISVLGGTRVSIATAGAGNPILVTDPADDAVLMLQMPCRVSSDQSTRAA